MGNPIFLKSVPPNLIPLDLNPNGTNYKLIVKFKWKNICVKKISTNEKKINDSELDLKNTVQSYCN